MSYPRVFGSLLKMQQTRPKKSKQNIPGPLPASLSRHSSFSSSAFLVHNCREGQNVIKPSSRVRSSPHHECWVSLFECNGQATPTTRVTGSQASHAQRGESKWPCGVFHFHFVAWQLRMRQAKADREREKLSAGVREKERSWVSEQVSKWVSVVGSWLFNALDMKMSNETCDKRWSPFWVYCLMIWTFYTYTHTHTLCCMHVYLSRVVSLCVCALKQL